MSTLYSIGHGNKTIEEFEEELRSFGILYLIDVRTKPYSKVASIVIRKNHNELDE